MIKCYCGLVLLKRKKRRGQPALLDSYSRGMNTFTLSNFTSIDEITKSPVKYRLIYLYFTKTTVLSAGTSIPSAVIFVSLTTGS